jgi:type IV pilus assembly protein PilY1
MEFVMNISMHNVLPPKDCATRRKAFLSSGIFLFLALLSSLAAKAQTPPTPEPFDISQTPLITAAGGVAPNLLYIHDDSGSMDWQASNGGGRKQDLAKKAIRAAFAGLSENVRLGWATINNKPRVGSVPVQPFTGTHKDDFYTWVDGIPARGGTPLRTALEAAGQYYSNDKPTGPWGDRQDAACRKSFTILMTDGVYDPVEGVYGNQDGDAGTEFKTPPKPDGTIDTIKTDPFSDKSSNMLADIAWKYWAQDLHGADNNVVGTVRDPAWWQHMTTFTIGMELPGNRNLKKETVFENARTETNTDWDSDAVTDLLHAAVNGHGDFFLADNVDEFQKSLTSMLAAIQTAAGSNSKLAKMDDKGKNKNKVGDSTYAYEVKYNNTPNWYGQVLAYRVCNKNDVNLKVAGCDAVGDIMTTSVWDAGAATKIGNHADRNILSWNTATNKGIYFKFDKLSTTQQGQLANPTASILAPQLNTPNEEAILNYVRGDTSKETAAGASPNAPFRARNDHLLGDTFSDPLYHGPSASKGYETMSDLTKADQDSYKDWKKDADYLSTPGMLYVGANDGMLHGFDALMGDEKVAYTPAAVIPNLWKLADPDYTHEFYADATPIVEEAQLDGNWKNVLVGSTGMGVGHAYFAIDVTKQKQKSDLTNEKVLWEFTDPDLGHTPGNATIARLKGGQWVAIFGNGYNSENNTAHLFVVNLKDGALVKKFDIVGDATKPNGLSTPKAVDAANLTAFEQGTEDDLNGAVDFVYAGDVQGNLWRFDLSGDAKTWTAPTQPLLVAKDPAGLPQPITAQPLVVRKRDRKAVSGIMVYVGTGKFFELDDLKDTSVQSFYGVLDTGDTAASPYSRTNKLVKQTIGAATTVDIDGVTLEAATTSSNLVDYDAGDRGFFIDLTTAKERVLAQAQYLPYSKSKGTVLIATLVPTGGTCSGGSEGFWIELEALSGQKPEKGTAMLLEGPNRIKIGSTSATFHGGTLGNSKFGSPNGSATNLCNGPDCESPPPYCETGAQGTIGGVRLDSLKTCASPGRKSWRQVR